MTDDVHESTRRRFLQIAGVALASGSVVSLSTDSVRAAEPGTGQKPSFQRDAGNTGFTTALEGPVTDVEQAWAVDVGAPVYAQPVYSEETVVVGAIGTKQDEGRLVGIGKDGTRRWSKTGPLSILASAALRGDTLYQTSPRSVVARSITDGEERWSVSVPATPFASPTIADGAVLVGARDGSLRALSADDGTERWSVDFSGGVSATAAVRDGTVYAAADSGTVRALGISDGGRRWVADVGSPIRCAVTAGSDAVVVASADATLTALDPGSGAKQWTRSVDQPTVTSPVLADGTLYWAAGNVVLAIDLESGQVQWKRETDGYTGLNHVGPSPVGSQGTIYATTGRSTMYAFGRSDGTERWSFSPSPETDVVSVAVDAGQVYVGTADGRLIALRGSRNFDPTASFTYAPRDPSPGETVTFDAGESSDPDGSIVTYRWDFDGDGSFEATGEQVTHSFQEGTYDVVLEVVDDEGSTARETGAVTLSVSADSSEGGRESNQEPIPEDLTALVDRVPGDEVGVGVVGGLGALGVLFGLVRRRSSGGRTVDAPDGSVGDVATDDETGDVVNSEQATASRSEREPKPTESSTTASRTHPVETLDVTFDDLDLREAIGSGHCTEVREGTLGSDGTAVAVETLGGSDGETFDTDRFERFADGVGVWSKIDDHPNVASVVASGTEPFPWVAMERCGGSLGPDVVDGLSFEEIRELFVGVIEGVHHGHRYGLEHGALRPTNVLYLDPDAAGVDDRVPVVSDWELAAPHLDPTVEVGTVQPRFAAPEQVSPVEYGDPGVLADVYQLGVLGYVLFTGQYPIEDATSAYRESGTVEVTPPTAIASDLPTGIDDVLLTALSVDPDDRYETALHFRDALQAL